MTHAGVMDVAHHTDDLQPGRVGARGARDPFSERRGRTAPVVLGHVPGNDHHGRPTADVRPLDGAPRENRVLHGLEIVLRDVLVPPEGWPVFGEERKILEIHRSIGAAANHGQAGRCAD